VACSCEHGNEPLDSIKGEEFFDKLSDWRRLHNEKLHNLYASLSTIRLIKPSGMSLAVHVARGER